jgi:hypothetical protein
MKFHKIFVAILLFTFCYTMVSAQKLSDSSFNKMSRVELGNYYMKKSQIRKAGGYGLMAAGLGGYLVSYYVLAIESNLNGELSNGSAIAVSLLFTASTISLVASNPVLCAGSKYKGKAEMLLRTPGPNQTPSDIQAIIAGYKKQQKTSSIIAWTMLLGGFAGLFVSAATESEELFLLSTLSMFGSLPLWMNAARNKGRISVLMGMQSIPVSYLFPNVGLTSIGLSIPISIK